jgi:uncharacterized membrane protein YciS (DUF1049 family)
METIKDLFNFLMKRKKYWLVPAILVLFIIGFMLTAASGSAVAPFIYTIF